MTNVIFIDVLFLENFFMNYLLLYAANRFCRCSTKTYRLIISSVAGALYVIVLFYPNLQILTSMSIKFIVSLIMIIIAFFPYKIKTFIKITAIFYIEAFFIGGCTLGIYYFRSQVNYSSQAPIHISPEFFISSVLIGIFLTKIGFDYFDNYYRTEKNKVELQMILENKVCSLTALIDTGNSLKDPFTNSPVVIVYFKAIYDMLPDNLINSININEKYSSIMQLIINSALKPRIRILPFKALGTDNGLLTGIKIDMLIVKAKRKTVEINNPIIALYDKPLSNNNDYQALAYPEILLTFQK